MNRIGRYPKATKNFDTLVAANLAHLTAEAIIVEFPHLFDPTACSCKAPARATHG